MKNREIYLKNPRENKLANDGVAKVQDDVSKEAMQTLRYELETFVCDGQYEKGLTKILENYLGNIDRAQQQAVWVSGFFGSGKSHLVKMLRALWMDTRFEDGATARGIVDSNLSQPIRDALCELTNLSKRHGGLFAASGTLSSGAGDVRLTLLSLIFKAAGLHTMYPQACFELWLKKEGLYDAVKQNVEAAGLTWREELNNFHVARGLPKALYELRPDDYESVKQCRSALNQQFPRVTAISSEELMRTMNDVLTLDRGKMPLTLIILDEVQQFIGENSDRSIAIQELVEDCCKKFGGKLLFIATGQTAVTGTSYLKKLEGRFTIRVELSDADVDAVIRKVVLAKKPEVKDTLEQVITNNIGSISRHLSSTRLGYRTEDAQVLVQDYPILPVRRRFWEMALRALDQTGTDSQLRNQLKFIHEAIQTNLDSELGNVIPADKIFFESAVKLQQTGVLPRKIFEATLKGYEGNEDERLTARAVGLIFLINRLGDKNRELGIKAYPDVLADLMVENLADGDASLRARLPQLLDACDLLMKIDDEYRIQTDESVAWNDEFKTNRSNLANDAARIELERDARIKLKFDALVPKKKIIHGNAKVERTLHPCFDSALPADAAKQLTVWVRTGWQADEKSIRAEACSAGNESATIFVYIPKRCADDINANLCDFKAADLTLQTRGNPQTPEGIEAHSAMMTRKNTAEARLNALLDDLFKDVHVYQSGGAEVSGTKLSDMLNEAVRNSLIRLYPEFEAADDEHWDKVFTATQKNEADPLKKLGYSGEIDQHPVCKAMFKIIGSGKKGADIRSTLESAPYGWSRDAIDGALMTLVLAGRILALDDKGKSAMPKDIARADIGKRLFKLESVTITAPMRIKIRKVLQAMGTKFNGGEEASAVPAFLSALKSLRNSAGGDAPRPECPSSAIIDEIAAQTGNHQLLMIHEHANELLTCIPEWQATAERIEQRIGQWSILEQLVAHAKDLPDTGELMPQIDAVYQQRRLLDEPNPVPPLLDSLTQRFRTRLNELNADYNSQHDAGMNTLKNDNFWQSLPQNERYQLVASNMLHAEAAPQIDVSNAENILKSLQKMPLPLLVDRIAAMPARFEKIHAALAELAQPEVTWQHVDIPHRALESESDVEDWLNDMRSRLLDALDKGPVRI